MLERRVIYIAALAGGVIFYFAYREWLGWIVLLWLLSLPLVSLLVSLPAMLTTRVKIICPNEVPLDAYVVPKLEIACRFPKPIVMGSLLVRHSLSAEQCLYGIDEPLQTDHCGILEIRPKHLRTCDYMGIFCLPVRWEAIGHVAVLPVPLQTQEPPQLQRYLPSAWQPKPGGGFSENHDLRLYRPGDDLRHIHWKLSAKTGEFIYREPIEPRRGRFLLTMEMSGDLGVLDQKLGKLMWVSTYLQKQGIVHEIQCLTGRGLETAEVSDERSFKQAIVMLLNSEKLSDRTATIEPSEKCWTYHIGGEADAQR